MRTREKWWVQAPSQRSKDTDPARTAAYDVLRTVTESNAYANLVLPGMLHRRRIEGRDAAFATELTYGTIRIRMLYDAILATCVDRPHSEIDASCPLRVGLAAPG